MQNLFYLCSRKSDNVAQLLTLTDGEFRLLSISILVSRSGL